MMESVQSFAVKQALKYEEREQEKIFTSCWSGRTNLIKITSIRRSGRYFIMSWTTRKETGISLF